MTDHIVDINKKVLSPAAQKVGDAALIAYDDETSATGEQHAGKIAAAGIRALADRMTDLIPDVHSHAFAKGVNAAAALAKAIATELEGQP